MTKEPKYSEYHLDEGGHGRLDGRKFDEWIKRKTISIVEKEGAAESPERFGMRREGRSL